MRPDPNTPYCENANLFTDIYENAVQPRLPAQGSLANVALEHTTGINSFFQSVSGELCEKGRIGQESAESSLRFMARSAASGAVVVGTTSLVALGVVAGSPIAAIGLGVAGLAVLPPLAERAAFGIASFAGDVLARFRKGEE
jgi:hypothetical protein